MYRIDRITDKSKDREERMDGRYPLRKNCIVDIYYLKIGDVMVLDYKKDAEGKDKTGYLRTSLVEDIAEYKDGFTVFTLNSVYYLKRI